MFKQTKAPVDMLISFNCELGQQWSLLRRQSQLRGCAGQTVLWASVCGNCSDCLLSCDDSDTVGNTISRQMFLAR